MGDLSRGRRLIIRSLLTQPLSMGDLSGVASPASSLVLLRPPPVAPPQVLQAQPSMGRYVAKSLQDDPDVARLIH